jgi:hypothetical protein
MTAQAGFFGSTVTSTIIPITAARADPPSTPTLAA